MIDVRLAAFRTDVVRWMFLLWIGQAATTVGLVLGVLRLVAR